MRRTVRSNLSNSHSSSSRNSLGWLIVLCLITSSLAAPQYASPMYNSQYYGYNQAQLQLQQLQPSAYPGAALTYTQQYPAAEQSLWSGPPIVVNDEANSLELERQQQERQYFPIHYYNNRETDRFDTNNNMGPTPTRRAANHNYNNVPENFYHTGQQQPQRPHQQSQQELEQRALLAAADSRREDEQVVRIGGSRSLAHNNNNDSNYNYNYNNNNYYEAAQLLQRRNFEAKYAQHFDDYLRKYPQRLQPLHNTGPAFVDKK